MPSDVLIAAFSAGQGKKAGGVGYVEELSPTLRAADSGSNRTPCICIQGNTIDRAARQNGLGAQEELAYTLDATDRHAVCCAINTLDRAMVFGKAGRPHSAAEGQAWTETETANTLNTFDRGAGRENEIVCMSTGQAGAEIAFGISPTLNCDHEQPIIFDKFAYNCGKNAQGSMQIIDDGTAPTLLADSKPTAGAFWRYVMYLVRRLTPTEGERLQGYPDGWTAIGPWRDSKGKLHKESSDSARYKAIGNSIALPFWAWMMDRMAAYLPVGATLGSLFDGIGGFPLVWERIHGKGTARWASEIDEFAIAVTKYHFGGDDPGPHP